MRNGDRWVPRCSCWPSYLHVLLHFIQIWFGFGGFSCSPGSASAPVLCCGPCFVCYLQLLELLGLEGHQVHAVDDHLPLLLYVLVSLHVHQVSLHWRSWELKSSRFCLLFQSRNKPVKVPSESEEIFWSDRKQFSGQNLHRLYWGFKVQVKAKSLTETWLWYLSVLD